MKTYKLVKEYPGSPEIHSKITIDVDKAFERNICVPILQSKNKDITIDVPITHIIDYPDYWVEVKQIIGHTKDGYPISEGDTIYIVMYDESIRTHTCTTKKELKRIFNNKECMAIFDRHDKAKDALRLVKKCLSYNDIMKCLTDIAAPDILIDDVSDYLQPFISK